MKKYLKIFWMSLIQSLSSYPLLIGLSLLLLTCLLILSHLWEVVNPTQNLKLTAQNLVWYIAFNEWIIFAIPEIQLDMEEDVKSGRLAYLLPRPISYLGSKFAEATGALLVNLTVLGFVAYFFSLWWTKIQLLSSCALFFSILFGILAAILGTLIQILIGLSSFWLNEVGPFNWIWQKLLFVFGGLILPLFAYPAWMEKFAYFTPPSAVLGLRSAFIFDQTLENGLFIFFCLTVWILLSLFLSHFLFQRGMKVINIHGG